jgi:ketosteroid isomerase-like protein
MSEQNVEIAKRSFDAFNRRDFDALTELCDPAVTWRWGRHFVESDVSGIRELREFFEHWIETFPDVRVEFERALGDGDVLLFLLHQGGAGGASGVPSQMEFAQIITFANGRIRDVRNYTDRREALEAAGLEN